MARVLITNLCARGLLRRKEKPDASNHGFRRIDGAGLGQILDLTCMSATSTCGRSIRHPPSTLRPLPRPRARPVSPLYRGSGPLWLCTHAFHHKQNCPRLSHLGGWHELHQRLFHPIRSFCSSQASAAPQ